MVHRERELLFPDTANGPEPPCLDEANIDGLVGIDIDDLVYMVAYMFGNPNGPPPADCP